MERTIQGRPRRYRQIFGASNQLWGGLWGALLRIPKLISNLILPWIVSPCRDLAVQGSWNYGVSSFLGPIISLGVPWGTLLRVPKSISNLILHWNGLFLPGFGNVGLLELRCRQVIEAQKSTLVSLAKGPKSIKTGIPMCDFMFLAFCNCKWPVSWKVLSPNGKNNSGSSEKV